MFCDFLLFDLFKDALGIWGCLDLSQCLRKDCDGFVYVRSMYDGAFERRREGIAFEWSTLAPRSRASGSKYLSCSAQYATPVAAAPVVIPAHALLNWRKAIAEMHGDV